MTTRINDNKNTKPPVAANNIRETFHFKPIQSIIPTVPGQAFQNRQGNLIQCACETYPLRWRIEEAIQSINAGNFQAVADLLVDLRREISIAEAVAIPMPQVDIAPVKMEVK